MNACISTLVVAFLSLALHTTAAPAADAAKPESHTTRVIEGWNVRIDDRLLQPPHKELGARILKSLDARLSDIATVVGEPAL